MSASKIDKQFIKDTWDVDYLIQYVPLPTSYFPPGFISWGYGRTWEDNDINENLLNNKIAVYETNHPELKGKITEWKVLFVETYQGDKNCAYKQIVICHCDRVSESLSPELAQELERTRPSQADYEEFIKTFE